VSEIIEAAKFYVQLLGPCRGYALGDGYNIAPETPVDHMNALMDAATQYGRYPMNT
jgi:uroporphyrinogen-III decarboxylase